MKYYAKSIDGEKVEGGICEELPEELKDADAATLAAHGWYEFKMNPPEVGIGEIAMQTGFVRVGEHFEGVWQIGRRSGKYSVRSIIRELKAAGKYAQVRTLLETTGYDWEFVGSNYLDLADDDFRTMMSAIVAQGIMTAAEVNEMLSKCAWSK